jgi:branched-chain amino acid transport system permease protein
VEFRDILDILVGGLTNGMLLFIFAAGLTLVFGVLRIINFAHGAVYMLAAYLSYSVVVLLGNTPGVFWVSLFVAPIAVAFLGVLIEVFLLRPMYNREHLMQLLLTYSLVLVIVDATKFVWGPDPKMVPLPEVLNGHIALFGAIFSAYSLVLILAGFLTMIGLWLFMSKTKTGHIIRAGAFDPEMTEALGVNLKLIYTLIFALGAWMAGLAGVLVAPLTTVSQGMDATMLIEAFAVVVIGGMGSIIGAFIASIVVGLSTSFGLLWVPGIAIAFVFIVMAVVLVLRPWGLFGRPIK